MAPNTEDKKGAKPAKGGSKSKGKATAASKAALRGSHGLKSRKVRLTSSFHRPKTLRLPRNPRYPRKSIPSEPRLDQHSVIIHPLNTESAMKQVESYNTLTMIVNIRANKYQIKAALKKLYDIDCVKVNTMIRPDGTKKAFARLTADVDALDIAATKLGIV
ncbi:MAG: 60S ribosomal protein L25 [Vezdaea aestivalis]|nr:MAG: 60S ribosomal protein L25 [Vezdaea aestivalis]